MIKRVLSQLGVYAVSVAIGFVVVEAGYRIYLLRTDPRMHLRAESIAELPPIAAITRSLWQFDAVEGFRYAPRDHIFTAQLVNGRVLTCSAMTPLNKYGFPVLAEGNYEDADVKLAVFGNSFSMPHDESNTSWV